MMSDITFAVVGDFGEKEETIQATLNNVKNSNSKFFLALGDFFYKKNEAKKWISLAKVSLKDIFDEKNIFPAIGNHDDAEKDSKESRKDIIEAFKANGNIQDSGYYKFKKENILFIVMDTQSSLSPAQSPGPFDPKNPNQHSFVKDALEKSRTDPEIKWRIVCYHKPSVTLRKDHHGPMKEVHKSYHKLFDDNGVDLVLSGHNHNFTITHPINHVNIRFGKEPNIIDEQTQEPIIYRNVNGRIFMTIGTGGKTLRSEDKEDGPHYPNNKHISKTIVEFGILLINQLEDGKKLECIFRHNDTDKIDNQLCTLIKS